MTKVKEMHNEPQSEMADSRQSLRTGRYFSAERRWPSAASSPLMSNGPPQLKGGTKANQRMAVKKKKKKKHKKCGAGALQLAVDKGGKNNGTDLACRGVGGRALV